MMLQYVRDIVPDLHGFQACKYDLPPQYRHCDRFLESLGMFYPWNATDEQLEQFFHFLTEQLARSDDPEAIALSMLQSGNSELPGTPKYAVLMGYWHRYRSGVNSELAYYRLLHQPGLPSNIDNFGTIVRSDPSYPWNKSTEILGKFFHRLTEELTTVPYDVADAIALARIRKGNLSVPGRKDHTFLQIKWSQYGC